MRIGKLGLSYGIVIAMSWDEARQLRESLDGKFPRPRGGIVAEISDGIADTIAGANRATCQCREYVGNALKVEDYCPVHGKGTACRNSFL